MTEPIKLPRKVVVGVSFPDDIFDPHFQISKNDRVLVNQAEWYAEHVSGSLHFVTSIEDEDHPLEGHDESYHEALLARIEPALQALVDESEARGFTATYAVRKGIAWRELIMEAERHGDGMIMVSPARSEAPRLDHLIHGSTTQRLLRKSVVPVFVVHPRDEPGIDNILVPSDFSEVAADCVGLADRLHAECGPIPRLLLHCPDYRPEMSLRRLPDADEQIAAFRKRIRDEVRAEVDKVIGHERDEWSVLIGSDWIVRVVPEVIEQKKVDLMIMGSVARTGISGLLMGNTAEKILSDARCSLLVIKPRGWSSPL